MRYEVTESKAWAHTNGRTASIYGSVPYYSEVEKAHWTIVTHGYTVRDNATNTVGLGRAPFPTLAEAQALADKLNAR